MVIFESVRSVLINYIPLILISPIIDTLFGKLNKKYSDTRLIIEIFFHIVILIILAKELQKYLIKLNINGDDTVLIQGIMLFGLQRNLIEKLNYITYEHPIRLLQLF